MICLSFTAADRAALEAERYLHPHPKVQRKLEAVYLKSLELPHHLICRICRISKPTLVRYLRAFEQEGLEGLKQLGYEGRPNGLHPHAASLEQHFRQNPPSTCAQAQGVIAAQTGVRRGLTQSAGSPLHQRNVHHGPKCLCAAQPAGRLLWSQERSAHPLSGQRSLPTVRVGASPRPGFGHRLGVSAHVFAEPQPDRTLLALGQKAMSERKVPSGLRDDEKRHPPDYRLGPSRARGGSRLVANLEFPTVLQNASNKLNRV